MGLQIGTQPPAAVNYITADNEDDIGKETKKGRDRKHECPVAMKPQLRILGLYDPVDGVRLNKRADHVVGRHKDYYDPEYLLKASLPLLRFCRHVHHKHVLYQV
jgi:hypothetical protein